MTGDERRRVADLLGRDPQGEYDVVVRDASGDPVVLRNAPLLDDGTPMPTRYWLISPAEIRRIGQLESAGGVNAAEAAVDADELRAAHQRYAAERDAHMPAGHDGPVPSGGVGGTRQGVKCLHAHWAWHLAGGDDPVGRWIEAQLGHRRGLTIGDRSTVLRLAAASPFEIPWGRSNLTEHWLTDSDPPAPGALTNSLGAVDDYLDDAEREHPDLADLVGRAGLTIDGAAATALARLEQGVDECAAVVELHIDDAEEVFRLVTAETAVQRRENPGLPDAHADTVVATLCIVLAFMRRLRLPSVQLDTSVPAT